MRRPSRFGSFETVEPLDVSPMTEPIPGWGYIGLYNKHGFIHTYVPLVGDIMYIGECVLQQGQLDSGPSLALTTRFSVTTLVDIF